MLSKTEFTFEFAGDLDKAIVGKSARVVKGGIEFSITGGIGYYVGGEPYRIWLNGKFMVEGVVACHELKSKTTTVKLKLYRKRPNKVTIQIFTGNNPVPPIGEI